MLYLFFRKKANSIPIKIKLMIQFIHIKLKATRITLSSHLAYTKLNKKINSLAICPTTQYNYLSFRQLVTTINFYNLIFNFLYKGISLLNKLENCHEKRINEIMVDENILYTCSNDFTVKLWDIRNNFQLIHKF